MAVRSTDSRFVPTVVLASSEMGRFAAFALIIALVSCAPGPAAYSGTVQTESVSVGSQTGGRVVEVDVAAGGRVRAGSIIVRLDPSMPRAQLDEALAQERSARGYLETLERGTLPSQVALARGSRTASRAAYAQTVRGSQARRAAAAAAVAAAVAAEDLAERNYVRSRSLSSTGDVSRQTLDEARSAYDQARAQVMQAQAAERQLVAADLPGETESARATALANQANFVATVTGTRPAQLAQARAQLRDAQASVAYAQARLRESTVVSPADGVVASFDLHPGDMLSENETAAIIDTFADPYVYIYASQADLGKLRTGVHVRVVSDTSSGTYEGVVETFDRTAQFTPQNVETADQRAELVYGVKIRIHDPRRQLLDGTTVTVKLP